MSKLSDILVSILRAILLDRLLEPCEMRVSGLFRMGATSHLSRYRAFKSTPETTRFFSVPISRAGTHVDSRKAIL